MIDKVLMTDENFCWNKPLYPRGDSNGFIDARCNIITCGCLCFKTLPYVAKIQTLETFYIYHLFCQDVASVFSHWFLSEERTKRKTLFTDALLFILLWFTKQLNDSFDSFFKTVLLEALSVFWAVWKENVDALHCGHELCVTWSAMECYH